MTLHDLSASDNLDSITSEVFYNEIRLLQIMKDHPHKPQTIRMKTNFVINMVSTSLVLALVPADEAEWNKLQTLYDLINEVMICPYPYLTPQRLSVLLKVLPLVSNFLVDINISPFSSTTTYHKFISISRPNIK